MPRPKPPPHRAAVNAIWSVLAIEGVWRYSSDAHCGVIQTGPLSREEVDRLSTKLGWPVAYTEHGFTLTATGNVRVIGRFPVITNADGHPVREVKREDGSSAFLPASSPAIAAMVA